MNAAPGIGESCKVVGLSVATISFSLTQINVALTTILLVSNIAYVWWKIRRGKKD